MIRFNKSEMEKKLKFVMEFIRVPDEEKDRIQYATVQKMGKSS